MSTASQSAVGQPLAPTDAQDRFANINEPNFDKFINAMGTMQPRDGSAPVKTFPQLVADQQAALAVNITAIGNLAAQAGLYATYNKYATPSAGSATADLANIPANKWIEVENDETVTGSPTTRYQKVSGALTNQTIVAKAANIPTLTGGVSYGANQGLKNDATTFITEIGGAGDFNVTAQTGTNNFFPLLNFIRAFTSTSGQNFPHIHFPWIPGKSNVYYLQYTSNYSIGSAGEFAVLTADPGVSFYLVNVQLNCRIDNIINAPDTAVTKGNYLDIGGEQSFLTSDSTKFTKRLRDKRRFVGQGDLLRNKIRKPIVSSEFGTMAYTWPGSTNSGGSEIEVTASTSNVVLTTTSITFNSAGTGRYEGGEIRLLVGQRLSARCVLASGDTGFVPTVFARSALGFYGVSTSGGNASIIEKQAGQAYVQAAVQDTTKQPQLSYRTAHASFDMVNSLVEIDLLDAYTFRVMVDGDLFQLRTVPDPIEAIMLGGFLAGSTSQSSWTDIYVENDPPKASAGLIGLFVIGDSRQSDQRSCPIRYCAEYIDGSLGARVFQVNNQAVAGQDSSNQLSILQSNGVPAGTTDTIVAVGTNNVQNQSSLSTFYSDLTSICTILKTAKSRIVLDVFPLWYTQAQAGSGQGQNSTNYAAGSAYRAVVMQVAVEQGVPIINGLIEPGLLISNFVNASQSPNLTYMDPVLVDNIHGTPTLNKLQGFSQARAILGQLNKTSDNNVPWTAMPSVWAVQNGWGYASGVAPLFRQTPNGEAEFVETLTIGTKTNGTLVQGFGKFLTPKTQLVIPALTNLFEPCTLVLGTDGGLRCYGLAAATGTTLTVSSRQFSAVK